MVLEKNSKILSLPDHSRVWIYQSDRPFEEKEQIVLQSQLNAFVQDWSAHGSALTAVGEVVANQFIILAVDEKTAGASGCSIDKSVHFMQSLENQYVVHLFDRLNFTFLDAQNTVKMASSSDFKRLHTEGVLSDTTLVFDNLIKTVGELRTTWLKPLASSWHKRFV